MDKIKKRINYIDIAKGIALFLVIWGHLIPYTTITFRVIFSFHMPLFFILSGMSLDIEKYNFFEFVKKKAKQLVLPYFLFSIVGLIFTIIICILLVPLTIVYNYIMK